MKIVRKWLSQALGFKGYLRLVSRSYLWLTAKGLMRNKYPELFYLEQLIKPGFVCLDIGANLGYYTRFLSKLAGKSGHVYAVEPVPVFQVIWKENMRGAPYKNTTLLPYALGASNTTIRMGTPTRNGLIHHGMTKVVQPGTEQYIHLYEVEMKVPDELFALLPAIDFVKCDVEGYESLVFANMVRTLQMHKPIIQTELNGEQNRQQVSQLLKSLGYQAHILQQNTLVPISFSEITAAKNSDFYFLPNAR